MKRTSIIQSVQPMMGLLVLLQVYSAYGAESGYFSVGSQLPQFTVGIPDSPEVQRYLGLSSDGPFKLSDIDSKMVLIDLTNSA